MRKLIKKDLILAIDQGTTGTTALLVNQKLEVLSSYNTEFRQFYPKPGWVEHDLGDIWNSVLKSVSQVLKSSKTHHAKERIAAIGITNQRETICFWSRKSKMPLSKAIVWQDRRTSDACLKWKSDGKESWINQKTGLLLDPYFSGSKVAWSIENNTNIKRAADCDDLCIGTIDSFLVHKFTNGESHVTEPSNASRTLLFNINTLEWDDELLEFFKIPKSVLPTVLDSTALFGKTSGVKVLPDGIPIHGMLGDQQAALLGQACIEEGMAKCTYGTGSFILMNTGNQIKKSAHRLLSTVAWKINGNTMYALEGGAFTAGAAVQWVRDGLKFFKKSSDIEKLSKTVKLSDGVVFVPGFTGIGAPHWLPNARASFFGITRGTSQGNIARAVLEGIALMNYDILKAMEEDLGYELKSLNVDGGACANNMLMQFQADVLDRKLIRPKMIETTSLGAVFAAGLGVGVWSDLNAIKKSWKSQKVFKPNMTNQTRMDFITPWRAAINMLKGSS